MNEEMVSITIDISQYELAKVALASHSQNMTINDFVVSACTSFADQIIHENGEETDNPDSKTELFEDIQVLSGALNNAIEEGMTSLELTGEELTWLAKALDDSFSVHEIAIKLNRDSR